MNIDNRQISVFAGMVNVRGFDFLDLMEQEI